MLAGCSRRASPHHTALQVTNDENALLFAQLIARAAKDVDVLIDSLPSDESTAELQTARSRHYCLVSLPQNKISKSKIFLNCLSWSARLLSLC